MRKRLLFTIAIALTLALGAAACGDDGESTSSGEAGATLNFKPLDVAGPLTKAALTKGDIQVGLILTSDADIAVNKWVLLDDDKKLQPAENLIPAIRKSVDTTDLRAALDAVSKP